MQSRAVAICAEEPACEGYPSLDTFVLLVGAGLGHACPTADPRFAGPVNIEPPFTAFRSGHLTHLSMTAFRSEAGRVRT